MREVVGVWDGGQNEVGEEEKGLELGLDGAWGLALADAQGLVEELGDGGDDVWDLDVASGFEG